MSKFSENLKKIRKDNNLSQEMLAEELGVSRQAISKWESDAAYPEMEKLVLICSRFNLNIDDLLNKDIREVEGEKNSKNKINKTIDEFLRFVTDTVNLFIRMKFKTRVKCLLEQVLICFVLFFLFFVVAFLGEAIVHLIFYSILPSKVYYGLFNILEGIYIVGCLIISVSILFHTFKSRYLDYYNNLVYSNNSLEVEDAVDEKEKVKKDFKFDEKIIIRDADKSDYKFISSLFKPVILLFKLCVFGFGLFIAFFLILFLIGLVLSFTVWKCILFFIGLLIVFSSLAVGSFVVVLFLFNFVFNRENKKKVMIWIFLLSIVSLGIGCGVTAVGTLKFDTVDYTEKLYEKRQFNVAMSDKLMIDYPMVQYVEREGDDILIEYDINKFFTVEKYIDDYRDYDYLEFYSRVDKPFGLIRFFIGKINSREIIYFDDDFSNVVVYASKENIAMIKENVKKYRADMQKEEDLIDSYEERIDELEKEIEEKEETIFELQDKINETEDNT